MKSSAASLLTSAALLSTAAAGSDSTWLQWSSSSTPAPAPAPVTWTDWVTSVETIYSTVNNYITVTYTPAPVTVTQAPVTVTKVLTETDVETDVSVSVSVSGSVATIVNTATVVSAATVVNTVTNVPPPNTVTVTSVAVSVVVSQATVTNTVTSVSLTTTTNFLSGIVTCPTRTLNPTYTPATPLPSDYLWGCPPGYLCKPPRVNCNFEQNLPADTYVCSPDECHPVVPLPPQDLNFTVNPTCAFITPIDDYFYPNPELFQLDYSIFNIYGNPVCPVTSYISVTTTVVSGTTVAVTVPTTIVQVSAYPTTVVDTVVSTQVNNVPVPTTLVSSIPVPTTVVVPTTVSVTEWSNVPVYETVTASSTWGAWNSKVTKRAELEDRDLEKRVVGALFSSRCLSPAVQAVLYYQNTLLVPALCSRGNNFEIQYSSFTSCTSAYPLSNGGVGAADPVSFSIPVNYCNSINAKRSAAPEPEPEPSAPAFRFARG